MSGASSAQQLARQAVAPAADDLVDLGTCSARPAGGDSDSLYALIPETVTLLEDVAAQNDLQQYYHPPTGALVVLPPGVDVDAVLG